ncbi:hypothetical protein JQK87_36745 [Streptomyces sp. G44]|uniref:hypothetical protein n=1 Tax=Streptomyces sp. G44 TaxID=2807632 RepID=UPI00196052D3|nr:hypothetical protein [Streptomyces sp. G44]MBM7173825.1 hypothetical protein [Streptomyces sp. G44]
MDEPSGAHAADELRARVEAATTGTPYRFRRTEPGFDLIVDVPRTGGRRDTQVHTYRVALCPAEGAFTLTDVVRTDRQGPFGTTRTSVEKGRVRYRTWSRSLDGSERHSFSSADGHRLIRGVTEELGWRELKPAAQKAALVAGAFGGLVALGTLVALAIVFWP